VGPLTAVLDGARAERRLDYDQICETEKIRDFRTKGDFCRAHMKHKTNARPKAGRDECPEHATLLRRASEQ
jgi:hypothetical protein